MQGGLYGAAEIFTSKMYPIKTAFKELKSSYIKLSKFCYGNRSTLVLLYFVAESKKADNLAEPVEINKHQIIMPPLTGMVKAIVRKLAKILVVVPLLLGK